MSIDQTSSGTERLPPPYYTGYFNLGPIQIPPRPPFVGMTDRTTGTVWYLGWDGIAHLILTNTPPVGANIRVYAPFDGPYLGSAGLTLGVNNGHLVFDAPQSATDTAPGRGLSGSPVYAFNLKNTNQQIFPEPTNIPTLGAPAVPGVPSSTPVPTGGGYAAYQANLAGNLPPSLFPVSVANPNFWDHLAWQGLNI